MRKAKKRKSEKIEKKAGKWKTLREKIKKYIESFFFNFVLLYLFFYYFFAFRVSEKFRRSVCEFSLQTLSQFLWKPLLTLYVFLSLSFFIIFLFCLCVLVCLWLWVWVRVSMLTVTAEAVRISVRSLDGGWAKDMMMRSGPIDFFFFFLRFGGISFNVL